MSIEALLAANTAALEKQAALTEANTAALQALLDSYGKLPAEVKAAVTKAPAPEKAAGNAKGVSAPSPAAASTPAPSPAATPETTGASPSASTASSESSGGSPESGDELQADDIVSLEDLQASITAKAKTNRAGVVAILQEFGAKRGGEVKEADRAACNKKLQALA